MLLIAHCVSVAHPKVSVSICVSLSSRWPAAAASRQSSSACCEDAGLEQGEAEEEAVECDPEPLPDLLCVWQALAPLRSLCSALRVSQSRCCLWEELLLLLVPVPGCEPECSPGSDQCRPLGTAVLPVACTAEAPQQLGALAERRVLPAYLMLRSLLS